MIDFINCWLELQTILSTIDWNLSTIDLFFINGMLFYNFLLTVYHTFGNTDGILWLIRIPRYKPQNNHQPLSADECILIMLRCSIDISRLTDAHQIQPQHGQVWAEIALILYRYLLKTFYLFLNWYSPSLEITVQHFARRKLHSKCTLAEGMFTAMLQLTINNHVTEGVLIV